MAQSFAERSKETLLPSKGYSDNRGFGRHEGCWQRFFLSICDRVAKSCSEFQQAALKAYEMGWSDPRKVVFAAKMGLTLSFVSLLIFFREPLNYIGQYSIWAILTVVVVFEFSIGATLNKGFNRALGTLSAGALALGIAELSELVGQLQEVVIVLSIFIAGFCATYLKLYPPMKSYEYGFRVFLLTFCIVLVSGSSHFVQTAVSRLLLIAVGAGVCLLVNICVYPIWAGEDLHKLVVKNFKGVANSLEGYRRKFFSIKLQTILYIVDIEPYWNLQAKRILCLVLQNGSHHMDLTKCSIILGVHMLKLVALLGIVHSWLWQCMGVYFQRLGPKFHLQASSELRQVFKNEIQRVGNEGAKVLRLLGEKVERMEKLGPGDLLQEVHKAAEDLQMMIDQKSYLLVSPERWESGNRPDTLEDPEHIQELKDNEHQPSVVNSPSESTPNLKSTQTLRDYDPHDPYMGSNLAVPQCVSGENVLKHQTMWPSRLSLIGDNILNERELLTYESASALSLATFTSLLIEFVARLQNLVNSFEELSKKAKFKDPVDIIDTPVVGIWTRLFKFICYKD
ncbi:aluminum-activated malate transporter 4-like isoform X2 [Olea europaea var. sylvestris]|uniref:aluminum-activated malate transporter 4-like isoform X2 n=1 Tax=Olea europaea var. sylvestris TaxID=158386 RepID=UPI000C1CD44B|nr:aluminum-activated malate transporter 4-like isoform X2 [Olea europaea var. sylvestris]